MRNETRAVSETDGKERRGGYGNMAPRSSSRIKVSLCKSLGMPLTESPLLPCPFAQGHAIFLGW